MMQKIKKFNLKTSYTWMTYHKVTTVRQKLQFDTKFVDFEHDKLQKVPEKVNKDKS